YCGMMSPHMSNTSGAFPATIAATSWACQSPEDGWTVTLPILSFLSNSVVSATVEAFIHGSGAFCCQSKSTLPLPWATRMTGVGAAVGAPAAAAWVGAGAAAAACVGAAAAAAGLVGSAAAGAAAG